ncbi:hypothetical protein K1T71_008753 [Dendrolimus kikuchii]|uniref:Uncharacterized protein n=1 Tax=Dendrolimus kikuchii TaxID=765133 RepID=A0ACC1CV96_9NEOP|nr:hypothetical protein K1T71_008753 [Dendrolimus kikuchii]
MVSIPEHALKLVDSSLSQTLEEYSHTLFITGSKNVGKTTLLYSFLDKTDTLRETLVLEYSFGRKSRQSGEIEKTLCHIWEYGGKLNILKNTMSSIPIQGKYFLLVMVDLSKIKSIWDTIETCLRTMYDTYSKNNYPEVILIGGKYDIFKNYDGEIKKFICTSIRGLGILHNASVLFCSNKEQQLLRRAKEMLYNIGFGNNATIKDKNTNYTKPLSIPKGSDSWESIGIAPSTLDKLKIRHISRIASDIETNDVAEIASQRNAHAEPDLDTLVASKYNEIRNMAAIDSSVDDYLLTLHK